MNTFSELHPLCDTAQGPNLPVILQLHLDTTNLWIFYFELLPLFPGPCMPKSKYSSFLLKM